MFRKFFFQLAIDTFRTCVCNCKRDRVLCLYNDMVKPQKYLSFGKRFINIIHTRLRHNCILNSDLFRCNLIDSPNCSCGFVEDAYHLFFVCKKYAKARNSLMNKLFALNHVNIIDTYLLLWGDDSLTITQNIEIFKSVQIFLSECNRFSKNV